MLQIGCDCEWEATLSGDINGKYEGEIAAYEDKDGQLRMFFFTGLTENDYPRVGLTGLSMPTGPGTFKPYAFSITLGPDDPVLSGGSEVLLFGVQLIVENIVEGVIAGRVEGRIGGITADEDDIVEADINMTFRARLKGEGTSNPCSF